MIPPNMVVTQSVHGVHYAIDQISSRDGAYATRNSFAVVTARSYHPNLVNALFMDGSVRTIHGGVDLAAWWGNLELFFVEIGDKAELL